MLKILTEMWSKNKDVLRKAFETTKGLNNCNYRKIVKMTFKNIYNKSCAEYGVDELDLENMSVVDDGSGGHGTLLFIVPFDTYEPKAGDYLMTFAGYGSCSCCDTLQGIQDYDYGGDMLTDEQVDDFMALALHILQNTIKPYTQGWHNADKFDTAKI